MTVAELIEKLKLEPLDATVVSYDDGMFRTPRVAVAVHADEYDDDGEATGEHWGKETVTVYEDHLRGKVVIL